MSPVCSLRYDSFETSSSHFVRGSYSERVGLTNYALSDGIAECVLSKHFHPRGYTERNIVDSIVECCTQDCGEILDAIKD